MLRWLSSDYKDTLNLNVNPIPDGHIAIRLAPGDLANPDADIRYRIPDLIAELTDRAINDNGYDYTSDETMIIFLLCKDPQRDVQTVIDILRENQICGNAILDTAVIGVSKDATTFDVVYPAEAAGKFIVAPW